MSDIRVTTLASAKRLIQCIPIFSAIFYACNEFSFQHLRTFAEAISMTEEAQLPQRDIPCKLRRCHSRARFRAAETRSRQLVRQMRDREIIIGFSCEGRVNENSPEVSRKMKPEHQENWIEKLAVSNDCSKITSSPSDLLTRCYAPFSFFFSPFSFRPATLPSFSSWHRPVCRKGRKME